MEVGKKYDQAVRGRSERKKEEVRSVCGYDLRPDTKTIVKGKVNQDQGNGV